MGLADTHHIGRIVIHPHNPNIVYVAAPGHLWGANHERGIFKTTDGGKTWAQVLYINDDTGGNDIAIDPESRKRYTPRHISTGVPLPDTTAAGRKAQYIRPPTGALPGTSSQRPAPRRHGSYRVGHISP